MPWRRMRLALSGSGQEPPLAVQKVPSQSFRTGAPRRKLEPSFHAENGFATSWAQSMKSLANGLSVRFFIVMISIANG
jgi:hypothetical protein